MSATKTAAKPSAQAIADAIHSVPPSGQAPDFAAPPRGLLPVDLHPLLDDLVEAHGVLAVKKKELSAAVQASRTAKSSYNEAIFDELQRPGGGDTASVVNREGQCAAAEEHARKVMKVAKRRVSQCHYLLTAAVAERRSELLTMVAPVAEQDAEDERAAAEALAAAQQRLAASRGVIRWISEAEPGALLKAKRPYRA